MVDYRQRLHLGEMTQPEAARALDGGTIVLVTGSIEQHGGHLPLGTDAIAALTVGERVATTLGVPLLQLSPVGVAPYHMPWAGSLTLSPETFMALMVDVCDGLARAGVSRVLLVNWHEGNTPSVRLGVDKVQQRHPLRIVVAESHIITNSLFPDEMEFTHAGSMETAAVLAHDPSLVRLDHKTQGGDVDTGNAGHALFRRRDVFPVLRDFREVSDRGWYGTPERVTQERAEEIFTAVAAYIVDAFRDVSEQLNKFDEIPAAGAAHNGG